MLEESALIKADQGAQALMPAAVEAAFGVAPAAALATYLDQTQGANALKGPFRILGAAAMEAAGLPLDGWDQAFPDTPFPAIALGSDGWGRQ